MDDIINNQRVTFIFVIKEVFLIPGILYACIAPFVNFYLFYFILVPKFLFRKKILQFIAFAALSSFIMGYLARLTWVGTDSIRTFIPYIIFTLAFGFLGFVTKKTVLWRKSVAEKIVLNKKLYASKSALLMLQAQLNPHFLFNSLNNIDIMIEENPKTASEYLKKLSDILRYVLYETKENETELSKEIDQIKSYIELQKIRTDNPRYVNFAIKGELKDQKIAPMIFIPLIENAFKHCKNKSIENAINIEFEIDKNEIKMLCRNFYEENQLEIIKNEGLGIETIKQRLNLLYPKNHELVIDKSENWFNVRLNIALNI
jgi:LytS/YehU family sensor histidine kinase